MPLHQLPDAQIFYEVTGQGQPAVVLIHGGGCAHSDWDCLVDALSPDLTVLTLDLRGHGCSTGSLESCTVERWAADVNALIETLGIGPAVMIGHSLGSRIAAEAIAQRPAHAAGLILLDGSRSVGGFAANEPPAVTAPATLGDQSLTAIIDATIGPYADATIRRQVMATMSAASLDLLQQTVAAYTAWDMERADTAFAALPAGLPILAIQSTYHDRFTPRRSLRMGEETTPYLDFLRRALPQLEVSILPETGHFAMMEKSARVAGLIRAFVARAKLT